MKTQYATIFFLGFIQLSLVSSCTRNKNIAIDSSPKDTIIQTIDMDLLPRDTINFRDLPIEAQKLFIPYIGYSEENLLLRESLYNDNIFNLSKYEIRDSVDTVRGTHNFILHMSSDEPKRFFFINEKTYIIYRGTTKPFLFVETNFIYPCYSLGSYYPAEESEYVVIDLKKYLEE